MQQSSPMEIGIAVIDFDRMYAFYTEVLGCEEVRRADIPAQLSEPLSLAERGYLCVWLKTPGDEIIKLMSPPEPPDRLEAPDRLTTRTGIAYMTFYCTDLDAVLAEAEARGATLRSDRALMTDASQLMLCFFADPEGNIVELVQPAV